MNGLTTYGGGVVAERNDAGVQTFPAGFDFARRLRDPEFRSLLRRLGWKSGQHVVMAVDEEPVVDVLTRVVFHETGGRAFIAIPDSAERYGFRFLLCEVVTEPS